jgi:hypothetical protein
MITDATNLFSDSQAITATAASTNVIDLGATGTPSGSSVALSRDIGKSAEIPLLLEVTEAFNNLTSLAIAVQVATDAAFTTPVEVATRTYLLAELTLGKRLGFPAEFPEGTNLRFVRMRYTVTGTAPTTGKIWAGVVAARQTSDA